MEDKGNIDKTVVRDFGTEWSTFDQTKISKEELYEIFNAYFSIFPWDSIPPDAVGFDLGCGSGRWDQFVAPRVGKLYCIDPAVAALDVAKQNVNSDNVEFICAGVDAIPLQDNSMDFGFSLGVLHHVPDTQQGINSCVKKLKPGAPFLLYLYYAFDNRPGWFRAIWKCSDLVRRVISRLPYILKLIISQTIAVIIYWPLARFSGMMEKQGKNVSIYPLSSYRNKSFYSMRTDSYDRFCTRLEKRFTKAEILTMMENAGLISVTFRNDSPYWCAIGFKSDL